MKGFGDLHLCLSFRDLRRTERMVRAASELGYRFVGVPLPPRAPRSEIRRLQEICNGVGVGLITRLDLKPERPSELLRELRRLRRRFEVVSVMCASKAVARQAAKDRRVDLLSFPTDPRRRFFDRAEAELASGSLASLEVEMAPLLMLRGGPRIRLLSSLRSEVDIARQRGVPIVVSSGVTDEYLLRTPHDYAALASVFDLPLSLGLRALSENPRSIVERNREKLSLGYVAPGIRVIRRGKDCLDA